MNPRHRNTKPLTRAPNEDTRMLLLVLAVMALSLWCAVAGL